MKTPWKKILFVLIIICILSFTACASNKSKKSKRSPTDKNSKEKSTKAHKTDTSRDINPKFKHAHNRTGKGKPDKKVVADGSQDVPVITENILQIQVEQNKAEAKQHQDIVEPRHRDSPYGQSNCLPRVSDKSESLQQIEQNVTSLWAQVKAISQPVHIHVHGGHVSSPRHSGNHGCRGRCHGGYCSEKENDQEKTQDSSDGKRFHGCKHNHRSVKSHIHRNTSVSRHSHSHDSQAHGNNSVSQGTPSHKHHHHSHKSHHHSHKHHHHSHKSHHHSHKSHHNSRASDAHVDTDYGDKVKNLSHGHGHRHGSRVGGQEHSPRKGHDHRRGDSFREGRGYSTHVHIHVTIDEKPDRPRQSDPVHEHPDKTSNVSKHEEAVYARCDLRNHNTASKLVGYVLLRQTASQGLDVKINISGFPVPLHDELDAGGTDDAVKGQNLHGFHVHEFGDFSQGCASFGGHYNPEGVHHGGLDHNVRHVGDWGNIEVNDQGIAVSYISVNDSSLRGPHSILGRGIVVHGQEDDLGQANTDASKSTGSAGARLACCIVGQIKPIPDQFVEESLVDTSTEPRAALIA